MRRTRAAQRRTLGTPRRATKRIDRYCGGLRIVYRRSKAIAIVSTNPKVVLRRIHVGENARGLERVQRGKRRTIAFGARGGKVTSVAIVHPSLRGRALRALL